jgi:multicomponent Na+:H+ antiporter subunit E
VIIIANFSANYNIGSSKLNLCNTHQFMELCTLGENYLSKRFFFRDLKSPALTALLFSLIWLVLVEFDSKSFIVGAFFIIIATSMSYWLRTVHDKTIEVKSSIRLLALPKFVLFFMTQSIVGGLDTAKRAFSPSLNIKPGFIKYQMRFLTMGVNSHIFTNLVSLLPGSLIVMQEPDGIIVHVLSLHAASHNDLAKCESIVANLYGIDICAVMSSSKAMS